MKKSEVTRLTILENAYDLIYLGGYHATSIDDILVTTKVTKGAFYYHFKNKDEMGIAIIKEVLQPKFLEKVQQSFSLKTHTVDALYTMVAILLSNNDFMKLEYGCPLSNFIQELAPKNTAFTEALGELVNEWQEIILFNIEKGREAGLINTKVQPISVARFIISSYWGIRNFGSLVNGDHVYHAYLIELKTYLNTLK